MGQPQVSSPGVLVTGGAGYIGSHTCKALAAAGYRPVTFDNLSLGHRWAVRWGPLVEADLLDATAIAAALREHAVGAVVHFAASAYVGESVRDPAAYYRNGDPVRLPIDESHPTVPLSPYGQTKLDCENALRWYGPAYGLRWMGLRYFNAAGADPDGEIGEDHDPETRLVPRAVLAAMGKGPPLNIFGNDYDTPDGTAVRDYVHVADLAQAHVLALRAVEAGTPSRVINLGTGTGFSVREVMNTVAAMAGSPVPHLYAPRRAGDPSRVIADAAHARAILRWSPRHSSIDAIVRTTWQWHQRSHS
jgi:UDP-arabinose 4-epimerase